MSAERLRAQIDRLLERKSQLQSRLAADSGLAARLRWLQVWQALRLERTYADLRADALTARAMSFFLSDLYGPQDFTRRDTDLTRALGVLRHTLPPSTLQILVSAIELEVLSKELDVEMAVRLPPAAVTDASYAHVYQEVGRPEARRRQIELVLQVGEQLDRAVRIPLVGLALRAARTPARIMGFGALQDFIERGFAAFAGMPSAAPLLEAIRERENAFMASLLGKSSRAEKAAGVDGGV